MAIMDTKHRITGRRASDILKWWPIVAAVGLALMSYAELRFQAYQNAKDLQEVKETNKAQWQRIGDLMQ